MPNPKQHPIPMNLRLAQFDAELHSELSRNCSEAKLLRLIADYIDGRSYAQIAAVMVESHRDAKTAMNWVVDARREIASTLKLLVLQIALESKEQEHMRGLAK